MERRTVRNRYAHETGDELFSMKTICPHSFRVGKFFYVEIICTLPLFRVCSIRVKQLSTIATWKASKHPKADNELKTKLDNG